MAQLGRPKGYPAVNLFKPTDEQRRHVMTMTGLGITQEDMALMLRIDPKTLAKHFRRELDTGMTEANVRVAQALFVNCTKNMSVQAQIWWTKTRMGWKDTSEPAAAQQLPLMIVTGVVRDADFKTIGNAEASHPTIGVYTATAGSGDD